MKLVSLSRSCFNHDSTSKLMHQTEDFDRWTSKYSFTEAFKQELTSKRETEKQKEIVRNAISMAPSCNTMLIPRRDDTFLFYVWIYTARSGGACVSLSLSDRWLPDITHKVRQPLILNIAALSLSSLYSVSANQDASFLNQRHPTCKFVSL